MFDMSHIDVSKSTLFGYFGPQNWPFLAVLNYFFRKTFFFEKSKKVVLDNVAIRVVVNFYEDISHGIGSRRVDGRTHTHTHGKSTSL